MSRTLYQWATIVVIFGVVIGGIWYWWQFGRPEIKVNLDEEFYLRVSQVAFIESENIKIKFLDVIEDSRCPSDVQCVWEGQVTVLANIKKDDQNLDFSLTLMPKVGEAGLAVKDFDGHSIKLIKVEPYPKNGAGIELSEYIATFLVSRGEIPELTIKNETADWKTYRNDKYGHEVRYPGDWFVYDIDKWESDNANNPCNQTSSPKHSMENTFILSQKDLGICVGFVVWEQWPGEFIVKVYDEEWPVSPPYVLGESEAALIEVSGVPAVKYPFTEKSELPRKQAARIYLNYGGKGYLIEFVQTDTMGNYDLIYDQIISTFKFLE